MSRPSEDPSSTLPSFPARLRRLREDAGLSQTALAGSDLHPSYISLLESGRRVPTAEVVALLAARLGVTSEVLTGEIVVELEGPLALAEAALGLGSPQDAVAQLEPLRDGITAARAQRDPLVFRAGLALATGLERVGRLTEATEVLEDMRTAADAARGRLPGLHVAVALVRCYRDGGDLARAVDVGETTLARCHGLASAQLSGHAQLVSTLASAYVERGDLLRAQLLLDELVESTARNGTLDEQAAACWNAAITAAERGDPVAALELCEQAATLVAVGDDLRAAARLQVTRAWILLAQQPARAEEAQALVLDALPHLRQYAGTVTLSSAETELARCAMLLGDPGSAVAHAASAAAAVTDEHPIERARALAVLGAAYVAVGDRALGLASLEEAAGLLEGAGSPRNAAAVWRSIADVLRSLGDLERAWDAAQRALDSAGLRTDPAALPAAAPAGAAPSPRPERTTSAASA
ncbi:MAG: helix-turn-helix domain-containing protein [Frankiales bacterium]|nr:helix-turn-helix domain-containing protein [Frankiales bacterium]